MQPSGPSYLPRTFEPCLVAVGGPSAVGKTALVEALVRENPAFQRPRSVTTRARRDGEGDSEYRFCTELEFDQLVTGRLVPEVDIVYGNRYAILTSSVTDIVAAKRIPIKEVHPENHARLKKSLGRIVSALILPTQAAFHRGAGPRAERDTADQLFYSEIDPDAFDVVLYSDGIEDIGTLAATLGKKLLLHFRSESKYPPAAQIARENRAGYDAVAIEFRDDLRVTTRNFHQLTIPFFEQVIRSVPPGCRCAEVGPGAGWLRSAFGWPAVRYLAIEIAPNMGSMQLGADVLIGNVAHVPLRSGSFDFVFCSLADGYCFPQALAEIHRLLDRGGKLIMSLPSAIWASGIRVPDSSWRTTFRLSNGNDASVHSFVYTQEELHGLLVDCGFVVETINAVHAERLPDNAAVSAAIANAALKLGVHLKKLPVVDCVVASKP